MRNVLFTVLLSIVLQFGYAQCLKYEDLIKATSKPIGKFTCYESKNGDVFTVGKKAKIGTPSNKQYFSFIEAGSGTTSGPAGESWSGTDLEIKKIYVTGSKSFGWSASLSWNDFFSGVTVDIENAISSGELVSSVLTSDQALEQLKKAKDKLDLGLISQVKYDSIKAQLSLIIK